RVLRHPERDTVGAAVHRGDLHLPGLEFPGWHRHRLSPGDLRLQQLHLLRLDREIAERGAVPLRQGQASDHAPLARRVREQLAAEFRRHRTLLPSHAQLPRRLPAGEIHHDRHLLLRDGHLALNQRTFFQSHRLDGGALRRLHGLRHAPAAAFFLHDHRNAQRNLVPAHHDLRLVLERPRLQIHRGLRHAHRCRFHFLGKRHRLGIHRDLRQAFDHLRRPPWLVAAVQVLRQEFLRRHEHRRVVYRTGEPVAFVGRHDVLHREIAVAQRDHNPLRLRPVYPRVIGALHHHQRGLDLVGRIQRRAFLQPRLAGRRPRIRHARVHLLPSRFPIRRHGIQQGRQVRRPHNVRRRTIHIPRLSALPTAKCTTSTSSTKFCRRSERSTSWITATWISSAFTSSRIKAFYGTSENAVKTQTWIAVSVYVLVAIVRKRLGLEASLYQILQILSLTLFEKTPILQAFTHPAPRMIYSIPLTN